MHYQRLTTRGTTDPRPGPKSCAAPDCDRRAVVRGVCGKHNHRLKSSGTYGLKRPDMLTRFMSYVREDTDGCWLWQGTITEPRGKRRNGYGRFWINGTNGLAHRVSWMLHNGPIPEGFTIDHLCNVPACVNPAHLDVVTQAENNRRRDHLNLRVQTEQ